MHTLARTGHWGPSSATRTARVAFLSVPVTWLASVRVSVVRRCYSQATRQYTVVNIHRFAQIYTRNTQECTQQCTQEYTRICSDIHRKYTHITTGWSTERTEYLSRYVSYCSLCISHYSCLTVSISHRATLSAFLTAALPLCAFLAVCTCWCSVSGYVRIVVPGGAAACPCPWQASPPWEWPCCGAPHDSPISLFSRIISCTFGFCCIITFICTSDSVRESENEHEKSWSLIPLVSSFLVKYKW